MPSDTKTRTWNMTLTPADAPATQLHGLSQNEAADLIYRLVHGLPVPSRPVHAHGEMGTTQELAKVA